MIVESISDAGNRAFEKAPWYWPDAGSKVNEQITKEITPRILVDIPRR